MPYVSGTLAYTYMDNAGIPIPAGASGDTLTFNIRTILDAARFGVASPALGTFFYVWWDNEILKVTNGGAGSLSWTALRGQCGTHAIAHDDGKPIRETIPGDVLNGLMQSAAPVEKHQTVTANTTVGPGDPPITIVNAASKTITLPVASLVPERLFRVVNGSSGATTTVTSGLLNAPAAPVPTTVATGGTVLAGVYNVVITYVNAFGETVGSTAGVITTTGSTSTLTIPSPPAYANATGWYAYVTQAGGSTYTRQQTAGSPTAIGTALTLTAPPTSSGANPPSSNTAVGSSINGAATDTSLSAAWAVARYYSDGTNYVKV